MLKSRQGPPGTGKTHTIGNLVGHLLAQGKSVLVTSHTTKALRMVRHHIVPELRPLCVSVLESDLDSRRQLESAVAGIAERLSRADAGTFEIDAEKLEAERHELLRMLDDLRRQLTEARADEYRELAIGDDSWSPAEAARKVAQEKDQHGWIPGSVVAGVGMPLGEGELAELYRTNVAVSREDENELSGRLPGPADLPRPEEFDETLRERKRLSERNMDFRSDLWSKPSAAGTHEQLESLTDQMAHAIELVSSPEDWKRSAIYAGSGLGTFTLLRHRRWKEFIASASVNGGRATRLEHIRALGHLARLKILRRDLARRWDRQIAPLGAPTSVEMGEEPEKTMVQFCDSIEECLQWQETIWTPLQEDLETLGFAWDRFIAEQPISVGPYGELNRIAQAVKNCLLPVLSARTDKAKFQRIENGLRELGTQLEIASRNFNSSRVIAELADAIARLDSNGYSQACARLADLKGRQTDLDQRRALLQRMESAAPAWAGAIRNRRGVHGKREAPGDVAAAWQWRQMAGELDRRAGVSMETLQTRSERLREHLRRITVELIDRRGWAFQARRTSSPQRQALVGWLDTIRRIGKGHGVRVPLLRTEAARKMGECRGAVPVWVMPLSRVVENFDPRVTRFDVVIIDEASQSDVMALLALYLGRTVLVVGDHEQVSPTPVGQDLSMVENLIFQYLSGIPNADLYDGQISIYDLA